MELRFKITSTRGNTLATCLSNSYAIPLGYAEFFCPGEMRVKRWLTKG
eukprot:COSAG02_NODE_8356_length_2600_cov_1.436226_1_plen_47_part_10